MSMPGFVFHFRCDSCNAISDCYSVFAFPNTIEPTIALPVWSVLHRCWGTFSAKLSDDDRRAMESDRNKLLAFAASLPSDSAIVGVPEMGEGQSDLPNVRISPDPICPYCGALCDTLFGYPPKRNTPPIAPKTVADFRAVPLSAVDLSVRATMICRILGLETLGQLEDSQAEFAVHPRATKSTVQEVDDLLELKPVTEE